MASALRTGDVDAATEMARLARRQSDIRDGSLTESTTGTASLSVQRRMSKKRLSRKSYSFRSDRQVRACGIRCYVSYFTTVHGSYQGWQKPKVLFKTQGFICFRYLFYVLERKLASYVVKNYFIFLF
jgi:hypothetical protein